MHRSQDRPALLGALLVAISLIGTIVAPAAATNEATSLVLHVVDTAFLACNDFTVNCIDTMPNVEVAGMSAPAVFLMVFNHDTIGGVQCAFDWDPAWLFGYGLWDCPPNQVNGVTPTAPGATDGTLAMAFDFINGPALIAIGRLFFSAAESGCLTIIESSYPFGTHVVSDTGAVTPIVESSRARVCAWGGGWNGCDPLPVEPATWGHIKTQYR